LENIKNLISRSTLHKPEQKNNDLPRIDFIRVYIKNTEDYHKVKAICEKHLPGVNTIFVVADICRENLLVEIEAITSSS
ncbi:MAG: hypothetical protein ACP5E3_16265, partial [Bacteroidales bacterium]